MKIRDYYKKQKYTFSFEFFPPKTPDGELKLFEAIRVLKPLEPSFVSVTYGAMGTTRANTLRIVDAIRRHIGIEVAAHLACVGHTKDDIAALLETLETNGVENIVALRGDPPVGTATYEPAKDGFRYASELVSFIRKKPKFVQAFSLAVAGYPEGHIECPDKMKDLEHLKTKVDAGADAVITQLFLRNEVYFDFVRRARKIGIHVPIIPGIMPVTHGPQIQRFATTCGASIPDEIRQAIERYGEDQAAIETFGIEYATWQCAELLKSGVPGIHFYTLNKSRATQAIYQNLHLDNQKAAIDKNGRTS